jgi:hypothetical protein
MASKGRAKRPTSAKSPGRRSAGANPAAESTGRRLSEENGKRREVLNHRHAEAAVERFQNSSRGLRGVFGRHFPTKVEHVETLAYHLASVEAHLPNTVEAIRLARYPGAGNRDPKRMALGLCENLSVLRTHVNRSIGALEKLANGKKRSGASSR